MNFIVIKDAYYVSYSNIYSLIYLLIKGIIISEFVLIRFNSSSIRLSSY